MNLVFWFNNEVEVSLTVFLIMFCMQKTYENSVSSITLPLPGHHWSIIILNGLILAHVQTTGLSGNIHCKRGRVKLVQTADYAELYF